MEKSERHIAKSPCWDALLW